MTNAKKLLGAAAFSLVLTGGGVAGALLGSPTSSGAQESTEEETTTTENESGEGGFRHFRHERGEHLSVAAEALGMSEEELRAALEEGKTIAEVAADEGVDVNDVIDALVANATENIRERMTALVNGELPLHHRGPGTFKVALDVAAETIGITEGELISQLQQGESIASVAEANDVEVDAVIAALVAEATARIDEKVAAGALSEERAAEIKENLGERITAFVNNDGPFHGFGHRRGHGFGPAADEVNAEES